MAFGRHIAVVTLSHGAPLPGVQATAKVTRRGPAESRATLGLSGSPVGPLISGRDNDASSRGKWSPRKVSRFWPETISWAASRPSGFCRRRCFEPSGGRDSRITSGWTPTQRPDGTRPSCHDDRWPLLGPTSIVGRD
jgi:hypothetical protein